MPPSQIIKDCRLSDEKHSTILCVEWAVDHFGLGLPQTDPLLAEIILCAKNDFNFHSFHSDFDFDL